MASQFMETLNKTLQTPQKPQEPQEPQEITVTGSPPTRLESLSADSRQQGQDLGDAAQSFLDVVKTGAKALDETAKQSVEIQAQRAQAVSERSQNLLALSSEVEKQFIENRKAREAIQAQRAKVENTFPLVRAVKSIFDPKWNLGYLKKGEAEAVKEMRENVSDAASLASIVAAGTGAVNQVAEGQLDLNKAKENATKTNISNAMTILSATESVFNATNAQIDADVKNMINLHKAADNQLALMTEPQVRALYKQSLEGTDPVVGGIRIPSNLLAERVIALDQRNREIQASQLALSSAQMDNQASRLRLQAAVQSRIISTLNSAEVQAAIANGGVINGTQFDLAALGQRAKELDDNLGYAALSNLSTTTATQAAETASAAVKYINGTLQNSQLIYGTGRVPEGLSQLGNQAAQQIAGFMDQINWARQNPKDPRAQATLRIATDRANQLTEMYSKAIGDQVKKTGGTKEQQIFMQSLITGAAVDPQTAATAMTQWLQTNSVPKFVASNPMLKKINDAFIPQMEAMLNGKLAAANTTTKQAELTRLYQRVASGIYKGDASIYTLRTAPAVGKAIGINVPVTDEQIAGAINKADTVKYAGAAQALGSNVDTVKRALAGDSKAIRELGSLQVVQNAVNTVYINTLAEELETAAPGSTKAIIKTLTDPNGRRLSSQQILSNIGGNAPGMMALDSATGGVSDVMPATIAENLQLGADLFHRRQLEKNYQIQHKTGTSIKGVIGSELALVSGASTDQIDRILNIVSQQTKIPVNARTQLYEPAFRVALRDTKMPTPELEAVRKKWVAQEFETSDRAKSVLNYFFESTP